MTQITLFVAESSRIGQYEGGYGVEIIDFTSFEKKHVFSLKMYLNFILFSFGEFFSVEKKVEIFFPEKKLKKTYTLYFFKNKF